jgi:hypothetical protein
MRTQTGKHRWTWLVNVLYALALVCAFAYGVALLQDWAVANLCFALCSSLPLIAYGIDVWHTPTEEDE